MDARDEEALERLRVGIGQWNAGALHSAPEIWQEDLVWVESPDFPGGGTHRGRVACEPAEAALAEAAE